MIPADIIETAKTVFSEINGAVDGGQQLQSIAIAIFDERNRCARLSTAEVNKQRTLQANALIRGKKREARDHESMKFAAIFIADAILADDGLEVA